MKLIFGLGNPGIKYAETRHNIGFLILDEIASRQSAKLNTSPRSFHFFSITHNNEEIIFIKPQTYMNLSGEAVMEALDIFENIEEILVVYDDIHLPLGKIRFRGKGSDGGHNGIKNITYFLNSEKFPRLRFGVHAPKDDLIEHVLGNFEENEKELLQKTIDKSIEGIFSFLEKGLEKTMNHYNSLDMREEKN
jgi:PTH1 family peptidyl-tRNA hydrolase